LKKTVGKITVQTAFQNYFCTCSKNTQTSFQTNAKCFNKNLWHWLNRSLQLLWLVGKNSSWQKFYNVTQSTIVKITTPTSIKTLILIHQCWEIFKTITFMQHILWSWSDKPKIVSCYETSIKKTLQNWSFKKKYLQL
jgi:hypothetical protein